MFGNKINITNKVSRIFTNKENKYSTELIYTADYDCNAVLVIYDKDKKRFVEIRKDSLPDMPASILNIVYNMKKINYIIL